jgi:hypothetical protein
LTAAGDRRLCGKDPSSSLNIVQGLQSNSIFKTTFDISGICLHGIAQKCAKFIEVKSVAIYWQMMIFYEAFKI